MAGTKKICSLNRRQFMQLAGSFAALAPAAIQGRKVLLACGTDTRGLVYALLELADRVQHTADPLSAMSSGVPYLKAWPRAAAGSR